TRLFPARRFVARRALPNVVIPTGAARLFPSRRLLARRAAQWRDLSFGSLLCDLCVRFLFHPGRLLPARRRRKASRSWFRFFLGCPRRGRAPLAPISARPKPRCHSDPKTVIPIPQGGTRAVCGLAHSVIPIPQGGTRAFCGPSWRDPGNASAS